MQDFYTLEEAAKRLNVSKDQLLEMGRRGELRAFLDRGTQRFRKQEIEELGRKMGIGSDPELQPAPGATPPSSDIFSFDLSGGSEAPSSHIMVGGDKGQKPGSDSDVRLVPQPSDAAIQSPGPGTSKPSSSVSSKVKLDSDSDVKLVEDDSAVPIGREKGSSKDSGVRLGEGGSGKILDSGVRLVDDQPRRAPSSESGLRTEELDLDAELRQAEKSAKPPSNKQKATPFELSKEEPAPRKATPSSSEFELKPAAANEPSDSVFDSSSEQIKLDPEDDSSIHVSASRDLGIAPSGINLHKPSDKGISLEKGVSDSSGETLALDLPPDKPKKGKKGAKQAADSSSEFELTLDDDIGLAPMEEAKGPKDVFKTDLGSPAASSGESSDISLQPEGSDEFAETSDFELALDEDSSSVEGETGSEVIVIDEDASEADATALRPDSLEVDDVGEVLEAPDEELAVEAAAEDEVSPVGRRVMVEAPPAEWGIWGAVHILTILFLIPTGFLLFEMLRSIWATNQQSPVSGKMFELISGMMK